MFKGADGFLTKGTSSSFIFIVGFYIIWSKYYFEIDKLVGTTLSPARNNLRNLLRPVVFYQSLFLLSATPEFILGGTAAKL